MPPVFNNVKDVDQYVSTFKQDVDGGMKVGFIVKIIGEHKDLKSATATILSLLLNTHKPHKHILICKLRRYATLFKKHRGYNLKQESNRNLLIDLLNQQFISSSAPAAQPPQHPPTSLLLLVEQPSSSVLAPQLLELPPTLPLLQHPTSSLLQPSTLPLAQPLTFSQLPPSTPPIAQPPTSLPIQPTSSSSSLLQPSTPPVNQTPLTSLLNRTLHPSPRKLKGDCSGCRVKRQSNSHLFASNKQLRRRLVDERLAKNEVKRRYRVSVVNQTLQRKDIWITNAQQKIQEAKRALATLSKTVERLEMELHNSTAEVTRLSMVNKALTKRLSVAEASLKTKTGKLKGALKENRQFQVALDNAHCELSEPQSDQELIGRQGKTYAPVIRKCIYKCLVSHVPVDVTASIIAYISEVAGAKLTHEPHASTVARAAYELGVLADLQSAEFMASARSLTIGWDATTVKGVHLNELHVYGESRSLTLTTGAIAGGKATDYAEHIAETFHHISAVYAAFSGSHRHIILYSILQKLGSTISDRACVNSCVVAQLNDLFSLELIDLKCNIHPLDGIANAARKALKEHEEELGPNCPASKTFGPQTGAVNVIQAISKLRYKDGKGDPTGFKAFLREEGISPKMLVRYVGNRLHVLFHLAGAIFFLRERIQLYLKKRCNQTKLRLAILGDLKNDVIIAHLQVLGLFGKLVTGPWMSRFYQKDEERGHLQQAHLLQSCVSQIEAYSRTSELMLTASHDCFGGDLVVDDILQCLQDNNNTVLLRSITKVASSTVTVLQRQLSPYLQGPLSTITEDLVNKTASAPCHNMFAERVLGVVDSQLRHAPNANMGTVDAKTKARINKTLSWLESLPADKQAAAISFATTAGAQHRKRETIYKRKLEGVILRREREKGQSREMTERRQKEKAVREAVKGGDVKQELLLGLGDGDVSSVSDVLNSVCGQRITHVWSTEEGKDVIYSGRIVSVKRSGKKMSVKIGYWEEQEKEEDAVDYTMDLAAFVVDAMVGDVLFC